MFGDSWHRVLRFRGLRVVDFRLCRIYNVVGIGLPVTPGLQIAQSKYHLHTFGPNVVITYRLGPIPTQEQVDDISSIAIYSP